MSDLSWRDAIQRVLEAEREPLHYTEIAERIAELGLKQDVGATPASSINAQISVSIKELGSKSPYERVSRGHYRLRRDQRTFEKQREEAQTAPEEQEAETGLINAFGMYWDRTKVLWEKPRLLGCQQIGSTEVDFSSQHGVYLLHDRREVVYVGRTTDQSFGARIKEHTMNRLNGRWDRFSWFGVYPVREDGSLDTNAQPNFSITNLITTMEALLIEGLEPRQNRKRGDGFQAIEYLQIIDPAIKKRQDKVALLEAVQQVIQ